MIPKIWIKIVSLKLRRHFLILYFTNFQFQKEEKLEGPIQMSPVNE